MCFYSTNETIIFVRSNLELFDLPKIPLVKRQTHLKSYKAHGTLLEVAFVNASYDQEKVKSY